MDASPSRAQGRRQSATGPAQVCQLGMLTLRGFGYLSSCASPDQKRIAVITATIPQGPLRETRRRLAPVARDQWTPCEGLEQVLVLARL